MRKCGKVEKFNKYNTKHTMFYLDFPFQTIYTNNLTAFTIEFIIEFTVRRDK